jgi:hypothetical protein
MGLILDIPTYRFIDILTQLSAWLVTMMYGYGRCIQFWRCRPVIEVAIVVSSVVGATGNVKRSVFLNSTAKVAQVYSCHDGLRRQKKFKIKKFGRK